MMKSIFLKQKIGVLKNKSNKTTLIHYYIIIVLFLLTFIDSYQIPLQILSLRGFYPAKCFDFINGEQKTVFPNICRNHDQYLDYLPCHLNIDPSKAKDKYILVLGSTGLIGGAFSRYLEYNNIHFVEVRGQLQFNLSQKYSYRILESLEYDLVFDLVKSNQETHSLIETFAKSKGATLIRTVKSKSQDSKIIEIVLPKVIGYVPIHSFSSNHDTMIYNAVIKQKSISYDTDEDVIPSTDVAKILFNILMEHRKGTQQFFIPQIIPFKFSQILRSIDLFHKNQIHLIPSSIYEMICDIKVASLKTRAPSVTLCHFVTTSFSNNLNKIYPYLANIINNFPDFPLNMFLMLFPNNSDSILDTVSIPETISSRLRIITIPKKSYDLVLETMNTSYMPEYFFRNIGARLSRTEYYFSSSSDVLLPPSAFHMIHRRLFSPFIAILPLRHQYMHKDHFQDAYQLFSDNIIEVSTYLELKKNYSYKDIFYESKGSTGDYQGGDLLMFNSMKGHINSKYTYFSDKAFINDISSFKVPTYTIRFKYGRHIEHFHDYKAPSFGLSNNRTIKKIICEGVPTSKIPGYERDSYGISFTNQTNIITYKLINDNLIFKSQSLFS